MFTRKSTATYGTLQITQLLGSLQRPLNDRSTPVEAEPHHLVGFPNQLKEMIYYLQKSGASMLKLDDVRREALSASGALTMDGDDEVFRGLTVSESNFILDIDSGRLGQGLAELMVYNQLIVRHETAKLLYALQKS